MRIEKRWDWNKTHPVIHLSVNQLDYQGPGLENAFLFQTGYLTLNGRNKHDLYQLSFLLFRFLYPRISDMRWP